MPHPDTRPLTAALGGVLAVIVIAACGNPAAQPQRSMSSSPVSSTSSPADSSTAQPATSESPAPAPSPRATPPSTTPPGAPPAAAPTRQAGQQTTGAPVVVLDPGHNGGNAAHPEVINRPVPAGRGHTKPCNTTGTATDDGYSEHAFNWDVVQRVRDALTTNGVTVVLTRQSDTGVGPCVDERADIGNRAGAAAVVSIHADGSTRADARGFHVAYSDPPVNAAQGTPSHTLATTLRDALTGAGFPRSNYIGTGGLAPRDDLAGLNLSERPAALVECGNMRSPDEAAVLSSPAGRQRYATAIANAILRYLGR